MLSVLIPVHNCKIVKLVEELTRQCQAASIDFEVICLDDGSGNKIKEFNRVVSGLFGVNYVELSENVGRSRIRNKLGALARYDRLLFIDCDSKIISRKYISIVTKDKDNNKDYYN